MADKAGQSQLSAGGSGEGGQKALGKRYPISKDKALLPLLQGIYAIFRYSLTSWNQLPEHHALNSVCTDFQVNKSNKIPVPKSMS